MLLEAVKYTIYDPFSPVWREAKELYIMPALDRIFSGKESQVKPVIDKIIPKVNTLLKEAI